MVAYKVIIRRPAEKELEAIERHLLPSIWSKIKALVLEPRPKGSIKLKDTKTSYRLRVGDYRIIYTIDDKDKIVVVIGVKHRREAY
ncbi:MAG TPA: type II toxin-antitoxin system RelE family toxin [Candidatus Avalokitesvara rifleensis]|uniref:type II toxin-antitoxin system RelE family toxin n=1 Tax=Candidatus Avalokitesvara rifleensis TaxID=3367620 RepID=UPI002713E56C|nr:type II toxin-antitoxin system RelE/ParE family toxin [Candidatus Brocadiales bacterium]